MHAAVMFSDVPDWFYSAACDKPLTPFLEREDMLEMYDKSPIGRVQNIKTPSLFVIGGDDRRCPPGQGKYFWKGLKANGIDTKM
mmetsp:Transcript_1010/g.886  ORF Transcript_1010/g.886 Transcript_1010/m.886 type:complete len:84 (-) Transcript_1010:75-326(-)